MHFSNNNNFRNVIISRALHINNKSIVFARRRGVQYKHHTSTTRMLYNKRVIINRLSTPTLGLSFYHTCTIIIRSTSENPFAAVRLQIVLSRREIFPWSVGSCCLCVTWRREPTALRLSVTVFKVWFREALCSPYLVRPVRVVYHRDARVMNKFVGFSKNSIEILTIGSNGRRRIDSLRC